MPVRYAVGNGHIVLAEGDITEQDTEAIVNAANSGLRGGGGVDGAIHRAGGPSIMEECRKIGGCPTGQARLTGAGKLKARYVIHAAGPVYQDGRHQEKELLESAYRSALELARRHQIKTLAFPSISTGVYGYPVEEAALIALTTIRDYLEAGSDLNEVRVLLFGQKAYETYAAAAKKILGNEAK